MLSIAPGGAFSLESAPFKLTEEMVDVMDGLDSPLFQEFVKAFTIGFIALKANAENIISTVKVLSIGSPFPCFIGMYIISKGALTFDYIIYFYYFLFNFIFPYS
jgi:phosphatidylinositol 4-kinase